MSLFDAESFETDFSEWKKELEKEENSKIQGPGITYESYKEMIGYNYHPEERTHRNIAYGKVHVNNAGYYQSNYDRSHSNSYGYGHSQNTPYFNPDHANEVSSMPWEKYWTKYLAAYAQHNQSAPHSNSPHSNTSYYKPGDNYYNTYQNEVNEGYTKAAWEEPYTYYVVDWVHVNHAPAKTEVFTENLPAVVTGNLNIGLFGYEPNSQDGVGTKASQDGIEYKVSVKCTDGGLKSDDWVILQNWATTDKVVWDTMKPLGGSLDIDIRTSKGTYILKMEARDVTNIPDIYTYSPSAEYIFSVQHNADPIINVTNKEDYLNLTFGPEGVKVIDHSFKRYDAPYWVGFDADEQDGVIVKIAAIDTDANALSLDCEVKTKTDTKEGSKSYKATLLQNSVNKTLYESYVFIPIADLKALVGEDKIDSVVLSATVKDQWGDQGVTVRTCSTDCTHLDCIGTLKVDVVVPKIDLAVTSSDIWHYEKEVEVICGEDSGFRSIVFTDTDGINYEFSASELVDGKKKFKVTKNGVYTVTAVDTVGNTSSKSITVSKLDTVEPPIPTMKYLATSNTSLQLVVEPYGAAEVFGDSGLKETVVSINGVDSIYTTPIIVAQGDSVMSYNVSNAGLKSKDVASLSIINPEAKAIHGTAEKVVDFDFEETLFKNKANGTVYELSESSYIKTNKSKGDTLTYNKGLQLLGENKTFSLEELGITDKTKGLILSFNVNASGECSDLINFAGVPIRYGGGKLEINSIVYDLKHNKNGDKFVDGGTNVMLVITLGAPLDTEVFINGVYQPVRLSYGKDNFTGDISLIGNSMDSERFLDNLVIYKFDDLYQSKNISGIATPYTSEKLNGEQKDVIVDEISKPGSYKYTAVSKQGLTVEVASEVTDEKPILDRVVIEPDSYWIGTENKCTFNAMSKYSIKQYEILKDEKGWQVLKDFDTYKFDQHGQFTLQYRALSYNGVYSETRSDPVRVDLRPPELGIMENINYEKGKSTITITASDTDSGFSHVLMPDGTEVTTSVTVLEVSKNGTYMFTAFDKAGNKSTKLVQYHDLSFDYEVVDIYTEEDLYYDSQFNVSVKIRNNQGKGQNIPLEIYYLDKDGKKKYVYQDTVNMAKGQELVRNCQVKMPSTFGEIELFAEVNGIRLSSDITPENNIKSNKFTIKQPNYELKVNKIGNWFRPGQYIEAHVEVLGHNVGSEKSIPILMKLDGVVISQSYVSISKGVPSTSIKLSAYIPDNTPFGKKMLTVEINPDGTTYETSMLDNSYSQEITVNKPDLGITINDVVIDDVTQEYTYPANRDVYTLTIKTKMAEESIKEVTVEGKVQSPMKNEVSVDISLDKAQTSNVIIVVESSCKTETKTYSVRVKRLNDNTAMKITASTATGDVGVEISKDTGKTQISLPTGVTEGTLNLEMEDVNAKIISVSGNSVNANKYSGSIPEIGINSTIEFTVTVSSEDDTVRKDYTIVVTNKNFEPEILIVNSEEVNGTMYGLGGVIRDNKFIEYGKKITKVDKALNSGRLNGIILEIDVKDSNSEQYLRGNATLGAVAYPIRWNSFDGQTSIKAGDIKKGYVYIDRSVMFEDFTSRDIVVTVSDYLSNNASETPITETKDKVTVSADIKPPVVSCVAQVELGMVEVSAVDTGTGLKSIEYRISKDRGSTWSEFDELSDSVIQVDQLGMSYVEVKATDNIGNSDTKLVIMDMGGETLKTEKGTKVYQSSTRVADFLFINTNKENAGSVSKEILDLFK